MWSLCLLSILLLAYLLQLGDLHAGSKCKWVPVLNLTLNSAGILCSQNNFCKDAEGLWIL